MAACDNPTSADRNFNLCASATLGQLLPKGLPAPAIGGNSGACPSSARATEDPELGGANGPIDTLEACSGGAPPPDGGLGLDCSPYPRLAVGVYTIEDGNDPLCCGTCCVFTQDDKVVGTVDITD
jgi:hypothetical protein